jgi:hypothetical protein
MESIHLKYHTIVNKPIIFLPGPVMGDAMADGLSWECNFIAEIDDR